MAATAQGDNRFNDQLPNDQTEEFRQGLERFYEESLRQLQAFERTKLTTPIASATTSSPTR